MSGVEVRECRATVTAWDGERGTVEPHSGPAVALLTATTVKAGGWPLDQVKVGTVLLCEIVAINGPDYYATVVRIIDIIDLVRAGGMEEVAAPPPEKLDDGGPAYPVPPPTELPSNGVYCEANAGMSLRDRFAIAALPALVVRDTLRANAFAVAAYAIADAMLAARKGGSGANG